MKRSLLIICAFAAILFGGCANAQNNGTKNGGNMESKKLVVYFSATGTTERVAKMIAKAADAELYPITPKEKYSSEDLDWRVKTSRSSMENSNPKSRPEIIKSKENLNDYNVIYLGFPNWWNIAPRIVNTFIESYNLEGKTVIPFSTSGGSGISNSVKMLKADYPKINWTEGKMLNNVSQDIVNEWVKSIR